MNKTPDSNKLTKLQELDVLLPREIRGQSHTIPRIISAVRRGERSDETLTTPWQLPAARANRRGKNRNGGVVATNHVFGAGNCSASTCRNFRIRKRSACCWAQGSEKSATSVRCANARRKARCCSTKREKAHPRVLDILLQLLDAARLTVATGQTLDFSGFYVWLTSNIGSAELMSLQHSNEATLERHVLTRAQQAASGDLRARE